MSDWYMGKLARQDQDVADAYAQQEEMQRRAYAFPQDAISPPPQQKSMLQTLREQPWGYPSAPQAPGAIADQSAYAPTQTGWMRNVNAVRPISGEGRTEDEARRAAYNDPYMGALELGLTAVPFSKPLRTGALAGGALLAGTGAAEAGPRKSAGDVIKGFVRGATPAAKEAPMSSLAEFNPRLHAKAEGLRGKYAHYGEDYPPTGPPELIQKLPDPNKPGAFLTKGGSPVPYANMEEALAKDATPGYFLEKKLLPEVEQFQKDRATILRDMEENGYERYFDPAKRHDVDPKHYGPFEDTSTAAAPKTAKTDAEWYERYGTPEARARLQEGYRKGQTVEGSPDWYLMGQLEKKYVEEFGAKEGRARFKAEFADMMAATTGGQSPYNNMLMQQYANVMAKRGERLPERSYELPFPIGGRFAAGNIEQAQKYIDEGQKGFEAAVNPKRYDFSSAYTGNRNAFVMDEQMMQAIEPGTNIPQWYGPATRVGREEAAKAGVDPRGFQDVGWAGLKAAKEEAASAKRGSFTPFEYEGPMIEHINRTIELTHRLTGKPRDEVFKRGVLRKEIPTYTIGGATLGGLAAQDQYRR